MNANESDPVDPSRGYELRDTNVRSVIIFMVGLTLFLIVAQVALWVTLKGLNGGNPETRAPLSMPPMADGEYLKLRSHEDEVLGVSAWVDKSNGKVRIPVDRAIDLLSERGLPPTGSGKTEAQINSHSGKAATAEPEGGVKK